MPSRKRHVPNKPVSKRRPSGQQSRGRKGKRTRPIKPQGASIRGNMARERKTAFNPHGAPNARRGPDLSKAFASIREKSVKPRFARNAREFSRQVRERSGKPRRRLIQPGAGRRIAASAGRRFMAAAKGAARVSAPYLRRAKESVGSKARQIFEDGVNTFDNIGETAIDYAFNTVGADAVRSGKGIADAASNEFFGTAEQAGNETIGTAGHLSREVIGTGGTLVREFGSAGGEIVRSAGSGLTSTGGNLAGKLIGLGFDGANAGINMADRGIRATARGLFVKLPRAAAQKVVDFISNRRAFREHINPNLAGGWKIMMRREGIPVTEDGFVVHTIKSNPLTVSKGVKREIMMDVEFGFNDAGEFRVRAKPVFNGANEAENAQIEIAYSKNFRSTRRAVNSFVRHIGRKKGAKRIVERYMPEAAFPEKVFVSPETEAVRAQAPVPENAALTDADINAAFSEARQVREPQGTPAQ